jgi:hypothetical protein
MSSVPSNHKIIPSRLNSWGSLQVSGGQMGTGKCAALTHWNGSQNMLDVFFPQCDLIYFTQVNHCKHPASDRDWVKFDLTLKMSFYLSPFLIQSVNKNCYCKWSHPTYSGLCNSTISMTSVHVQTCNMNLHVLVFFLFGVRTFHIPPFPL